MKTRIVLTVLLFAAAGRRSAAQGEPAHEARLARLETRVVELSSSIDRLTSEKSIQDRTLAALRSELAEARTSGTASEARIRELETSIGARDGAALESAVAREVERQAARAAPDGDRIRWGGYFDLEFRDDHAGTQRVTFDQHRLVLKFEADIAEAIDFQAEIEVEGGGAGVDHLTNERISVEYAELRFAIDEAINLKAGALLVPFGRFNALHDSPLQELTDRPLVDVDIIPTTWTEAGIGVFGAFQPGGVGIDYDVVLVNGLTDTIDATQGTRKARGSFRADNNNDKFVLGRAGVSPDFAWFDALGFGLSAGFGNYDDRGDRGLTMVGVDFRARKGPFELLGEFARLRFSRGDTESLADVPRGMEGFYVEARWHFFPESWRGTGPFVNDRSSFTLTARYDDADTDIAGTAVDFATEGDRYHDDRRRFTLGFNYRPIERTVFKLEYQWFFEPGGIPEVDNNRFVASFATYF